MDTISLSDGTGPKYLRLLSGLRKAVAEGQLAPGDRLPPVRDLAYRMAVTPGTVARSYRMAVEEGLLQATQGRGTFVAEPGSREARPLIEPAPAGGLNLRTAGVPDVGQSAIIAEALAGMPAAGPEEYLSYPAMPTGAPLAGHLAGWFASEALGAVSAEDVTPTFGGQQAQIVALTGLLHGARPVILTEDLGYPGIRASARLLRAELRGLPMDGEGLLPEAFDRAAAETGAQILVTSGNVHSPTTRATSPARRAEIAGIAAARRVAILDDDCFGFPEQQGPAYRRLLPEWTWTTATLSKSVSPQLRIGAIIAPPGQGARMRAVAQQHFYGFPRPLVTVAEAIFATGAAVEIRRRIEAEIAVRVGVARAALGRHEAEIRDLVPFAWLPLSRGWRLSTFTRTAEARGILVKAADEFAVDRARAPAAVRVTFCAAPSAAALRDGLSRLSELLDTPPADEGA